VSTRSQLVGVRSDLAGLAGLLVRTACPAPWGASRSRWSRCGPGSTRLFREQAADSTLTPAVIAAQLNTSLAPGYTGPSAGSRARRRASAAAVERADRAAGRLPRRRPHGAHVARWPANAG